MFTNAIYGISIYYSARLQVGYCFAPLSTTRENNSAKLLGIEQASYNFPHTHSHNSKAHIEGVSVFNTTCQTTRFQATAVAVSRYHRIFTCPYVHVTAKTFSAVTYNLR
jgi:hypothetical protein